MWDYEAWTGCRFEELKGKVILHVEVNDDETEMTFKCEDGSKYRMYHEQDCCEYVSIEDISGNISDITGSPILMAENMSEHSENRSDLTDYLYGSFTWTYYKLATVKGYVTIRWYGSSNGYYNESVDFRKYDVEVIN